MNKSIYTHGPVRINREELAWASGFFDGEGMVRCYTGHRGTALTHQALLVSIGEDIGIQWLDDVV